MVILVGAGGWEGAWHLRFSTRSSFITNSPQTLDSRIHCHSPLRSQLGSRGRRTRGKGEKTPLLREYYQPLKTFVPGGGGGYNRNNFPLAGDGALFSTRYGDTKARSYVNWSKPLIPRLDKLFWIFYLDRLDFSGFFNYGGAWYQHHFDSRTLVPWL